MAEIKKYTPIFENTVKKVGIKSIITSLREAQIKIKKIKEDAAEAKDIEAVIDELDDVITGAVEDLGAGNAAVSDLIDAAKDLEIEKDMADADEEVIMAESEEADKEDEEKDDKEDEEKDDDKEKVEEGELPPWLKKDGDKKDDEKKDDKEDKKDDKKEESFHRPYKSCFSK